jgi:protein-L-isoaspartate O-methyltransferase
VIEKRSARDVEALTPVTWAGVLPRSAAAPAEPDDAPSIAPGPFLAAGFLQAERYASLVEGHDFVVFEKPANADELDRGAEDELDRAAGDEYAPYGDPGGRRGNSAGLSDADLAPLRDLGYDLDAVRGDEARLFRLATLTKYLGPARDAWQRPHDVIDLFSIEPGQVVADVGSASGYFAWLLSRAVGGEGKVYAVDVDATACDFMRRRLEHEPPPHPNVHVVQSRVDDVTLDPGSIDHALLADAEFFVVHDDVTRACLASLYQALRPDGRVVVIETADKAERGEVTPEQIRVPFEEAGFTHLESHDLLRHASRNRPSGQHCQVFVRSP